MTTNPPLGFLDRVIFTASAGGTASFVETVPIPGFMTMEAAGALNGGTYGYVAQLGNLSQWEIGWGVWTPGTQTLSRNPILPSPTPVNFTGPPQVLITLPAFQMGSFLQPANGNVTLFVNGTTGSDTTGSGTAGAPFATIQQALNVASRFDYQNLYAPTINVANGTYPITSYVQLPPLVNAVGANLLGNVTTPANCVIWDTGGGSGVGGIFSAVGTLSRWYVSGFTLDTQGFNGVFSVSQGAALYASSGTTSFVCADRTNAANNYWLVNAQFGAYVEIQQATITFTMTNGIFALVILKSARCSFRANTVNFPATSQSLNRLVSLTEESWLEFTQNVFNNLGSVTFTNRSQILNNSVLISQNGVASDMPDGAPTGDPSSAWTSLLTSGLGGHFTRQKAGAPAASDLGAGAFQVLKDSTSGARSIVYNDGGTLYTRQIGNNANQQTGTAYTLALSDQEGIVEMNNALANTLTVPPHSSVALPVKTRIPVMQTGPGATTIAAGAGVTVQNAGSTGGQFKGTVLYQFQQDQWIQLNGAF